MDDDVFALLMTWTCYGTWLPGDSRGHVSPVWTTNGFQPRKNKPGSLYAPESRATQELAAAAQLGETVWLSREQARVTAESLITASRERGWFILRAAVMANHVHVVINRCPSVGPAVRRVLIGVSQARLSDYLGHPQRWWTRGGSDRARRGERSVLATVEYVIDQEGKLAEIADMILLKSPAISNEKLLNLGGKPLGSF